VGGGSGSSRVTEFLFLTQEFPQTDLMVADVLPGTVFLAARAVPLIAPWPYLSNAPTRGHDVPADGSFIAAGEPGYSATRSFDSHECRRACRPAT